MNDVWDLIRLIAPKTFDLLSHLRGRKLDNSGEMLLFLASVHEATLRTQELLERLTALEEINGKKLDMLLKLE